MVDDHNSDYNEGKPLSTEIETLAPEATADHTDLSFESTPTHAASRTREHHAEQAIEHHGDGRHTRAKSSDC